MNETPGPSGRALYVHLLPAVVAETAFGSGSVVVIDVLRASTTIIHALAAGAARIIPCTEVKAARQRAERFQPETALLGGERGGVKIDGFDLGNSPIEYTPGRCRGKTIIFTTTNGTGAMLHARQAEHVLVGALVNRRAVCRTLERLPGPVHLLCAGRQGEISLDDAIAAGGIVDNLTKRVPTMRLNDQAQLAWEAYRNCCGRLADVLHKTAAGENLQRIGLEGDIADAAQIDRIDLVPLLRREPLEIVAMST